MTPVIPYSISNVSLIPGTVFTRKACSSTRFSLSKKISMNVNTPCILLPRSGSFRLLLKSRSRVCSASATGTDVAVEEPETPVAGEEGSTEPETPAPAKVQSKRPRPKKSEFPPVKNEDLVAGAWFDGKVVSVQPFGAFVDFGAFTDGLVHVSQLSDGFVKEVGSVVSVGQEVKVRLVEAVTENGRISLSMRSGEDSAREQQPRRESSGGGGPGRKGDSKPRRGDSKPRKVSKFSTGQDLDGTVKNMNRAGAFVTLPEGEEGFLPVSEELDDGYETMMGETTLEVGQEVKVRVLKIARGQVTLTMKKEEDIPKNNVQVSQGVMHTASNPFLLAFRKNKDIAAFLDEREKKVETKTETVAPGESDAPVGTEASSVEEAPKESENEVVSEAVPDVPEVPVADKVETEASPLEGAPKESENEVVSEAVPDVYEEHVGEKVETEASSLEESSKESENEVVSEAVPDVPEEPVAGKVETEISSLEEAPKESENEVVSETVPEEPVAEKVETEASTLQEDVPEAEASAEASSTDEVVVEQSEEATVKDEPPVETQALSSATTESASDPPSQPAKAMISPALVKQLREETGAGMMDCKNALSESGGDMAKAQEYLRKKGLAGAEKKASRATTEGRVGSYIHDSRIGVLVEVNCETDFVSRGDIFRELVDDLAMQVAACPQVRYLSSEDVPEDTVRKEREIEMQKEDLASKPEQMRERIVDGRIKKRLDELALLEQPYIKNDKVVVKDFVKQTISTVGENIKVRRFVRFNLGEGLEKKSLDFAAEVAAQTAAKPAASKPQETTEAEPKEPVEKASAVAVSAKLVKQLRDESGAGMMDCKKALSESGGDLEKAQEYLRKKGLASADKKSSRIAAEGRIGSYIHDSRIGVLIEVNCETDFVGRSDKFKELVDDLAMQVAACPQVSFVSVEEIGAEVAAREKELEMQREDLQSKPESIRERIVEGRVGKRLGELALLEQSFIKDDSLLVKDLVRQTVAALGENIQVRRFVRFTLGEKLEGEDS